MPTFYAGDIATPQIRAWRFVFDEGNYWLLTAMQGALSELSNPNNWITEGNADADAASDLGTQIILSLEPTIDMIATILPFAGNVIDIPEGTLLCDGASYLRTDFPDLFTVIGVIYGSVDATHFNVPDLRAVALVGVGTSRSITPHALGDFFGEENHQLTVAELASHTHSDDGHSHLESSALPNATTIGPGAPQPTAVPGIQATGQGFASITTTGGDVAHNNIPPSVAINYVIVWIH